MILIMRMREKYTGLTCLFLFLFLHRKMFRTRILFTNRFTATGNTKVDHGYGIMKNYDLIKYNNGNSDASNFDDVELEKKFHAELKPNPRIWLRIADDFVRRNATDSNVANEYGWQSRFLSRLIRGLVWQRRNVLDLDYEEFVFGVFIAGLLRLPPSAAFRTRPLLPEAVAEKTLLCMPRMNLREVALVATSFSRCQLRLHHDVRDLTDALFDVLLDEDVDWSDKSYQINAVAKLLHYRQRGHLAFKKSQKLISKQQQLRRSNTWLGESPPSVPPPPNNSNRSLVLHVLH